MKTFARHVFLLLTLTVLAIGSVSCHTAKSNTTPSGRTDSPRNNRGHSNKNTDKTDDGWAKLDVKLSRGDNKALYKELKEWLGTPYKYAHNEKRKGTDCSGMVQQVYLSVFEIPLQRNAAKMFERDCREIGRHRLREADLVFFNNGKSDRITHVGIYLKDGHFVHASSSRGVMVSSLDSKYWDNHFQCAGRVKNLRAWLFPEVDPGTIDADEMEAFVPLAF